jgi:hypothetical protein
MRLRDTRATIEVMGETSSRARATQTADRALASRRNALIALTLAADEARDGESVYTAAEEKATAAVNRARQRAKEIISQARTEAETIRAAAREEMAARVDRWRSAYQAARDAGWTVRELQVADQARPPRAATRDLSTRPATSMSRTDQKREGDGTASSATGDRSTVASAAK